MEYGYKLKKWRASKRLTQRELAKEVGCSHQWISDLERGAGKPSIEFLQRIERQTGIPPDEWKPDSNAVLRVSEIPPAFGADTDIIVALRWAASEAVKLQELAKARALLDLLEREIENQKTEKAEDP